ncbi:MAG: dual specificity protein phosphatase family protein [Anaerolineaceae bacterium]|nr:dual specificity protein phosphatase family protein [Anaerolineaceae bacterium]
MEILTELPYGFKGKVYRSPMPFSRMFDPNWMVMPAYIDAGIDVVVVLTSWEEVWSKAGVDLKKLYGIPEMEVIYLPTPDFHTPDPDLFRIALGQVLEAANQGKNVAIHCHAGVGRTGIFAACLAKVVLGLDGSQAYAWVRQVIPGAVENQEQIQFIEKFDNKEE